jgi:hypothetical protein
MLEEVAIHLPELASGPNFMQQRSLEVRLAASTADRTSSA